jgi:hypothetical protein
MTLTQAQATFPNCIVKNRGYHEDDEVAIQMIYKSELDLDKRIVCLIKGEPYLVPNATVQTLKTYLETEAGLPDTIRYLKKQQFFRVPITYLVPYGENIKAPAPISSTPIVEVPVQPPVFFEIETTSSTTSPITGNKVLIKAEILANTLDGASIGAMVALSSAKSPAAYFLSNAQLEFERYSESPTEDSLVVLIANLLLINKSI